MSLIKKYFYTSLLLLLSPAAALADKTLLKFSEGAVKIALLQHASERVELKVVAPSLAGTTVFTLADPNRIVIDILQVKIAKNQTLQVEANPVIPSVRLGVHADKLRIVVDISTAKIPDYGWSEGSHSATLTVKLPPADRTIPPAAPEETVGAVKPDGKKTLKPLPTPETSADELSPEETKKPGLEEILFPDGAENSATATPIKKIAAPAEPTATKLPVIPTATAPAPTATSKPTPKDTSTPTATPTPKLTKTAKPTPTTAEPTATETALAIKAPPNVEVRRATGAESEPPKKAADLEPTRDTPRPVVTYPAGTQELFDVKFDYDPIEKTPVVKFVLKNKSQFELSKKDDKTYRLLLTGCKLGAERLTLVQFPPHDFIGFTMIKIEDKGSNLEVMIGVERGIRINASPSNNEVLVTTVNH